MSTRSAPSCKPPNKTCAPWPAPTAWTLVQPHEKTCDTAMKHWGHNQQSSSAMLMNSIADESNWDPKCRFPKTPVAPNYSFRVALCVILKDPCTMHVSGHLLSIKDIVLQSYVVRVLGRLPHVISSVVYRLYIMYFFNVSLFFSFTSNLPLVFSKCGSTMFCQAKAVLIKTLAGSNRDMKVHDLRWSYQWGVQ